MLTTLVSRRAVRHPGRRPGRSLEVVLLRLLTFGGLALVDGAAPVAGAAAQRSRLALLAVLAASGSTGVTRDKLLACLWPESDTERARHALKQAVYALRRDLGGEQAIAGTATLTLDPAFVTSDVRDFDEAITRGDDTAAVALRTGSFLDGFHMKGSAEFDRWCEEERARLDRAYGDALERLATRASTIGDHSTAVRLWRRRAAGDPLSGRIALSLMRAHADAGDLTGAVQHARVHEALVREELESRPDDAVLEFADRLRRGQWTPSPTVAPRVPGGPIAPTNGAVPPAAPPFSDALSPGPAAPAERGSGRRKRRRVLVMGAAALVVIVGAFQLVPASTRTMASLALVRRSAPLSPRRIVVAAFENRTGDSTLAPVGELAADWIARSLLEANFEVVDPRTSAIAARIVASLPRLLRGGDPSLALARETGAGTVVTGRYYLQRDSLQFEATVSDVTRGTLLRAVGPLRGPSAQASPLVGVLAMRVTAALAASTDTTPGGSTASLAEPPSIEAFEHASRAWEMFFSRPKDTAAVFAELARASALDSGYSAPLLMRAYVLDVKERWPAMARVVAELQPRRSGMSRIERAALELFEADLRGDLLGRLRAAREMARLSPGSADMALLLAVSASYVNRYAEAAAELQHSDPNRGINLVSPMYWAWRSLAAHALGQTREEEDAANESARRFPSAISSRYALARTHAVAHRLDALRDVLKDGGLDGAVPSVEARELAMFAARELRVHGAARPADSLFGRLAALPAPHPTAAAPREEQRQHALALYEAGQLDAAREAYTSMLVPDSLDMDAIGRLGSIAVRLRDSVTATRIDQRLARWTRPYAFGQPAKWRAHQAALRGDPAQAVALLRTAISQGYRPMDMGVISLHEESDFAAIRHDPGFRDLVRPRQGALELP
jgi:DNA-binding SARP family transcriptional activator/tetratricopeptide (TPR) repeat protein